MFPGNFLVSFVSVSVSCGPTRKNPRRSKSTASCDNKRLRIAVRWNQRDGDGCFSRRCAKGKFARSFVRIQHWISRGALRPSAKEAKLPQIYKMPTLHAGVARARNCNISAVGGLRHTSETIAAGPVMQRPLVRAHECSWLSYIGFACVTYNSVLAVYRSIHNPWMVAFVVGAYLVLMSLLHFLRVLERTPENSSERRRLKVVVWSLATVLTAMFSYRVAAIMPWAVKLIVWGMAATTTLGGFYALFIYSDKSSEL